MSIAVPTHRTSSSEAHPASSPNTTSPYDIVLGCPRSGTTFLMDTLKALPEVECLTGTVLPVSIPQIAQAPTLPAPLYDALTVAFERALDDYMHSGRFHSRAAALQKWANAPTGLQGLLDAVRGRRTQQRLIYKEPFLAFAPTFVADALPNARIVHLVRDGRDCANSLVRTYDVLTDASLQDLRGAEMRLGRRVDDRYVPWWVEKGREDAFLSASPYGRAIWMWAFMVRQCHEAFSEAPLRDRVTLLRYEDLVQHPETQGRALLEFLDLTPSRGFLRHLRTIHADSIGAHRRRPQAEILEAERIAGAELALYDYS